MSSTAIPHPCFAKRLRRVLRSFSGAGSAFHHALGLYREFVVSSFKKMLAYRFRFYTGYFTYFIHVSVYYFIWKAVYAAAGTTTLRGFTLEDMVTYVGVGWMSRTAHFNNLDHEIQQHIWQGNIAVDLIRPVDFQLSRNAAAIGEVLFRLLFFTWPICLILFLIYPIRPPASGVHAAAFAASLLLSNFLFTQINYLTGLSAVFLTQIRGLIWGKWMMVQLLSGLIIPLSFYPEWITRWMPALPFMHIVHTPLMIYLGKTDGRETGQALAVQAAWVVLLYIAGRMAWRACLRKMTIYGG